MWRASASGAAAPGGGARRGLCGGRRRRVQVGCLPGRAGGAEAAGVGCYGGPSQVGCAMEKRRPQLRSTPIRVDPGPWRLWSPVLGRRLRGSGGWVRIRGKPLAGAAATPKTSPLGAVPLAGGFGGIPLPSTPPMSSGESLRSPFPGDNGILVACSFLKVSSGDGSSGGGVGCGSMAACGGLISSSASYSGPGAEGSSRWCEGIGVPASVPAVGLRRWRFLSLTGGMVLHPFGLL